jgi:hypothetical protein
VSTPDRATAPHKYRIVSALVGRRALVAVVRCARPGWVTPVRHWRRFAVPVVAPYKYFGFMELESLCSYAGRSSVRGHPPDRFAIRRSRATSSCEHASCNAGRIGSVAAQIVHGGLDEDCLPGTVLVCADGFSAQPPG